ncbi:MAG: hypothetical protein FWD31_11100, partial [Planctomycetaceae bacterium]|nr:hypothetical protein [Planctomycetaceae bacterium]
GLREQTERRRNKTQEHCHRKSFDHFCTRFHWCGVGMTVQTLVKILFRRYPFIADTSITHSFTKSYLEMGRGIQDDFGSASELVRSFSACRLRVAAKLLPFQSLLDCLMTPSPF